VVIAAGICRTTFRVKEKTGSWYVLVTKREARADYIELDRLRVFAHDTSGNPSQVFHCPHCGSGSIVGGPNGIECVMCNRTFTVQSQPQYHGIPQTQNGLATPFPRPEDQRVDDYSKGIEMTPDFQPEVIVETAGLYQTAKGIALDSDAYIRHLAIEYATDRERILRDIKASRNKDR
jgi:hypothetical protein